MAVTSDGATLYVAAFGSSKIGVFDTAQLETDTFAPSAADHIAVSGGGPSGLVLDEARDRLYVLTRFDNSHLGRSTRRRATEIAHLPLYNPEPAERRRRAAVPLRRHLHLQQRRGVVRRAATSSATSTAWPGTSATPTT